MTFVEGTVDPKTYIIIINPKLPKPFALVASDFCLTLEAKDQQRRLRSSRRGVDHTRCCPRQVFEGLRDFKSMGPRVRFFFSRKSQTLAD